MSGVDRGEIASSASRAAYYREWLSDPRSFLLLARGGARLLGYAVVQVADRPPGQEDAWRTPEVGAEVQTLLVTAQGRGVRASADG